MRSSDCLVCCFWAQPAADTFPPVPTPARTATVPVLWCATVLLEKASSSTQCAKRAAVLHHWNCLRQDRRCPALRCGRYRLHHVVPHRHGRYLLHHPAVQRKLSDCCSIHRLHRQHRRVQCDRFRIKNPGIFKTATGCVSKGHLAAVFDSCTQGTIAAACRLCQYTNRQNDQTCASTLV